MLLVVFPYPAIVENSALFWLVILAGLAVSFICAASELAFALACGEGSDSDLFERNVRRQEQLALIALDPARPAEERAAAAQAAEELEALIRIGEDYSSHHNPRLVVADNVAKIFVAVVSTVASFESPHPDLAGQDCDRLMSLPPDSWRCISIFGAFPLPFPVSGSAFQSALALTLILLFGEMIPKQLGTIYPERVTRLFFPIYRVLALVGLGTGPSFGALIPRGFERIRQVGQWVRDNIT